MADQRIANKGAKVAFKDYPNLRGTVVEIIEPRVTIPDTSALTFLFRAMNQDSRTPA